MLDDDSGKTLESIILDAMGGTPEALKLLFEHDEVKRFLNDVSGKAACRYRLDREDLRQHLQLRIFEEIKGLKSPRAFKSWCRTILKNHCLDLVEKRKREEEIKEKEMAKTKVSTRKTPGGPKVVRRSDDMGPDREFLITEGVRRAKETCSREIQKIVDEWRDGKSVKEIAEETGMSIKTIYAYLKKFQKAVVEETGIEPPRKKKRPEPAQKQKTPKPAQKLKVSKPV